MNLNSTSLKSKSVQTQLCDPYVIRMLIQTKICSQFLCVFSFNQNSLILNFFRVQNIWIFLA